MPIEHISDTARWVAVYRAMESERPDRLFNDPFARRLAGLEGEDIANAMPRGRQMAWAMIVRTAVFDELILRTIEQDRIDLVVNLAAGLDARPWRLALPSSLRWVDVDLPGILEHKKQTIGSAKPICSYEAIAADLTDSALRDALFSKLGAASSRALIVTEGLLIYLTAEQVGSLATSLSRIPSFRWWIIDLASPQLLEMMLRTTGKALAHANAPFKFAPVEGTGFFLPFGWKEKQFCSTWDDSLRLNRQIRFAWLYRLMGRFASKERQEIARRFSGNVLLERV